MEHSFWHERWSKNEIGFHEQQAHPLLTQYLSELSLPLQARVFVPLCGKSLDIHWLLDQGMKVVGAELSELAISQLFNELNIIPSIEKHEDIIHYSADNIDIFVGDILNLNQAHLGQVDAIYDRAALVALPLPIRKRYANKLLELGQFCPQLLISFDYDQEQMPGPPFSVPLADIQALYANHYNIRLLENRALSEKLKGQCQANELALFLQAK